MHRTPPVVGGGWQKNRIGVFHPHKPTHGRACLLSERSETASMCIAESCPWQAWAWQPFFLNYAMSPVDFQSPICAVDWPSLKQWGRPNTSPSIESVAPFLAADPQRAAVAPSPIIPAPFPCRRDGQLVYSERIFIVGNVNVKEP